MGEHFDHDVSALRSGSIIKQNELLLRTLVTDLTIL
jgi:hypothetical protein